MSGRRLYVCCAEMVDYDNFFKGLFVCCWFSYQILSFICNYTPIRNTWTINWYVLYAEMRLEDTFNAWFRVLTLHTWYAYFTDLHGICCFKTLMSQWAYFIWLRCVLCAGCCLWGWVRREPQADMCDHVFSLIYGMTSICDWASLV